MAEKVGGKQNLPSDGRRNEEKIPVSYTHLTVYFFCETLDNGADIYVRTKFTEGKPYEFELTTYTCLLYTSP